MNIVNNVFRLKKLKSRKSTTFGVLLLFACCFLLLWRHRKEKHYYFKVL
jgi:hypothetical protein